MRATDVKSPGGDVELVMLIVESATYADIQRVAGGGREAVLVWIKKALNDALERSNGESSTGR